MQVLQNRSNKTFEKIVDRCNNERKITIIFNLKWIFVKTLSWQPFFLRIKKALLLDFIKISSIKPKETTKFTSLKDFHENKDNGRYCEIKS